MALAFRVPDPENRADRQRDTGGWRSHPAAEGGRDHLQSTVQLTVTSVLQTSAGRMIFGKFEELTGA